MGGLSNSWWSCLNWRVQVRSSSLLSHTCYNNSDLSTQCVWVIQRRPVYFVRALSSGAYSRKLIFSFLNTVGHCFTGTTSAPIYFSDVALADIFSLFAIVIGNIWHMRWGCQSNFNEIFYNSFNIYLVCYMPINISSSTCNPPLQAMIPLCRRCYSWGCTKRA